MNRAAMPREVRMELFQRAYQFQGLAGALRYRGSVEDEPGCGARRGRFANPARSRCLRRLPRGAHIVRPP